MEQQSSCTEVTILHELDLGQHTLFVLSDGGMDLIANDEQTVSLADNALHFTGDEAYRLFTALHEHFKQQETSSQQRKGKHGSAHDDVC